MQMILYIYIYIILRPQDITLSVRMLRPAGRLLVDDYLYTGAVTEAIDAFHRSVTRRSCAGHAPVTRRSRAGHAPVVHGGPDAAPDRGDDDVVRCGVTAAPVCGVTAVPTYNHGGSDVVMRLRDRWAWPRDLACLRHVRF